MPHFYFDVSNGHGDTPDDNGLDLPDHAAAVALAIESIRSMMAEDVRQGRIDLDGRIEIKDVARNVLTTVAFTEAFEVRIPR